LSRKVSSAYLERVTSESVLLSIALACGGAWWLKSEIEARRRRASMRPLTRRSRLLKCIACTKVIVRHDKLICPSCYHSLKPDDPLWEWLKKIEADENLLHSMRKRR
jgi:hypothetical protein